MLSRFSRLTRYSLLVVLVSAAMPAAAQQLELDIEIPRLNVAEYHRPYVAAWLQNTASGEVTNLAVWYDTELRDREGEKWLKDMRLWWRRSGRSLELPVDGVTGATRAPGTHNLIFSERLTSLPAGEYQLTVEAAREVGGRETVSIPLHWPPQSADTLREAGESELGSVQVQLKPGR